MTNILGVSHQKKKKHKNRLIYKNDCTNLYLPRETIMLIIGPEFDRVVWASFNDIFAKSTPSISSTLSIGCNFPYADECASTSLTNIP